MRQLPIPDESWPGESWNEAEAMGLLRRMGRRERQGGHARATADNTTPLHAAPGAARARQAALLRTVQDEVIPRLLQARRTPPVVRVQDSGAPAAIDIDALTQLALIGSQADVTRHVQTVHEAGMAAESLLLDLVAPVARRLGEMWDCDDCDFSEVTLGVLRLTHAVQSLEVAGQTRPDAASDRPGILLAQAPGGQHGLGLAILAQFFSRAGWDVRCETVANSGKLAGIVRQHRFGVVGLSVACTDQVDSLAATIRELRRASANRRLGIMVGGAAFAADPGLAVRIGADATASDGQSAVIEAQRLISPIARAR